MSATGDRRAGIALIEAMVVVAIAAMIAVIAFPQMRAGLAWARVQQAAAGLRADLRIARAQARTSGARVDLVIAEDGAGYGWTPGPRRSLMGGVRLAPAGSSTSFFPDGSAQAGRLRLTTGRRGLDIMVDPATGVVDAL
ncbi:GspH/FimT family pseudopilin [Caulobacter endophyticus]|uniref:GspH/FimT family pseudopilin n=1 Tax=Caulobacter endophyticus TaxID=2172652 RepID=UPI0024108F3D|nr:GspH/FimT family pseudopilin [Caulobacter endophyticus]MDG2527274.1 hypothetical protein [Caulobacter endophyticus]